MTWGGGEPRGSPTREEGRGRGEEAGSGPSKGKRKAGGGESSRQISLQVVLSSFCIYKHSLEPLKEYPECVVSPDQKWIRNETLKSSLAETVIVKSLTHTV